MLTIRWGFWPLPRTATVAVLVVLLALGALALRRCSRPGPQPPRVVTAAHVDSGRPTTMKPTIPQRIVTATVAPSSNVIAPGAARVDVARFCAAAGYSIRNQTPAAGRSPGAPSPAPLLEPPTAASPTPPPTLTGEQAASPAPRSADQPSAPVLWLTPGTVDRHTLTIWPDRSDGARLRQVYRIHGGKASWAAAGDSVIVRTPRLGVLAEAAPVLECGLGATVSALLAQRFTLQPAAYVPGAVLCLHGMWRAIR